MKVLAISLFFVLLSPLALSEEDPVVALSEEDTVALSEEDPVIEKVRSSTDEIIEIIQKNKEEINKNPELMFTLLGEKINNLFDMNYLPKSILGMHYRTITEEQMKEFTVAFERQMLLLNIKVFFDFKKVEIEYEQPIYNKKYTNRVILNTNVTFTDKDDVVKKIQIGYKLRLRNEQWKIYDFTIGGLSFIVTQRGVNDSIITNKGIDAFIQDIKLLTSDL